MKTAYVFFADGFEDVEAITPIDYLHRAGVDVTIVGVTGLTVVSSHGLSVQTELTIDEITGEFLPDLAVLPGGGKGSKNLAASVELRKFIVRMMQAQKGIGAICAAPAVVLGGWGLLEGHSYTCYPGMGNDLSVKPLEKRVVIDGPLVTARAAGVAEEFALALVRYLCGQQIATKVAADILARANP